MNKFRWTLVLLLLAVLSACGGAAQPTTHLKVTLTDFMFQPNQMTVPAGEEITFNGSNTGAVVHNFVIMKQGTSAGPTFEADDEPNVYWEVELAPGAPTDTSFTAPSEPGDYEVVCRTEGHIQSGMIATLHVVPEQ